MIVREMVSARDGEGHPRLARESVPTATGSECQPAAFRQLERPRRPGTRVNDSEAGRVAILLTTQALQIRALLHVGRAAFVNSDPLGACTRPTGLS
jgi:hypothetical protein